MASGTIAKLLVSVGVDPGGMRTGGDIAKRALLDIIPVSAQVSGQVQKDFDGMARNGSGTLASISKTGAGVLGTTIAVAAGLGALAAKFETDIAKVNAAIVGEAGVAKDTGEQIGQSLLSMAGTGIYSTNELIEAYAGVAGQLGLVNGSVVEAAVAHQFMAAAQNLAEGSGEDLKSTTAALAQVIQQNNKKVEDAAEVSNVLFNVHKDLNLSVQSVATSVEQLRGRLGDAAPALEDTAALVEELSTHAITGQRAVNQVATSIDSLVGKSADTTTITKDQQALLKAQQELSKLEGESVGTHNAAASAQRDYTGQASLLQNNLTAAQQRLNDEQNKNIVYSKNAGTAANQLASHQLALQNDQLGVQRAQQSLTNFGISQNNAASAESTRQSKAAAENAASLQKHEEALAAAKQKVALAQSALTLAQKGGNAEADALGISVFNAQGQFVGMRSIIEQLQPLFAKMTQEKQIDAVNKLFGTTGPGSEAMLQIINDGVAKYDQLSKAVGTNNSAQVAAAAATDNLASEWDKFKSKLGGVATTIALNVAPVFQNLLQGLSGAMPEIQNVAETIYHVGSAVIGAVAGPIGAFIGFLLGHQQLILAFLAFLAARFIAIKAINFGTEIVNMATSFSKLVQVQGPVRAMLMEIGASGGKTSETFKGLGSAIDDYKNRSQDVANAAFKRVLDDTTGSALEEIKNVDDLNSKLKTLSDLKIIDPIQVSSSTIDKDLANKLRAGMREADVLGSTQSALETAIANAATSPALKEFESAVENLTKEGYDKATAESMTKSLRPELAKAIEDGAADAAPKASSILEGAVSKGGLGKIFGKLNPLLNTVNQATAQNVYVTNWPTTFNLPGGSLGKGSAAAENILKDTSGPVEAGVSNALAKDAMGTSGASSISSKIVGGLGTVASTITGSATVDAIGGAVAEGATAASTAAAGILSLPVAAAVAGIAGIGLEIAGMLGHGPLSGLNANQGAGPAGGWIATGSTTPPPTTGHAVTGEHLLPGPTSQTPFSGGGFGSAATSPLADMLNSMALNPNEVRTLTTFQTAANGQIISGLQDVVGSTKFQALSAQQQKDAMHSLAIAEQNHNVTNQKQMEDYVSSWTDITTATKGIEPGTKNVLAYITQVEDQTKQPFTDLVTDVTGTSNAFQTITSKSRELQAKIENLLSPGTLPTPPPPAPAGSSPADIQKNLGAFSTYLTGTLSSIEGQLSGAPTDVQTYIKTMNTAFSTSENALDNLFGVTPTSANSTKIVMPDFSSLVSGITNGVLKTSQNIQQELQATLGLPNNGVGTNLWMGLILSAQTATANASPIPDAIKNQLQVLSTTGLGGNIWSGLQSEAQQAVQSGLVLPPNIGAAGLAAQQLAATIGTISNAITKMTPQQFIAWSQGAGIPITDFGGGTPGDLAPGQTSATPSGGTPGLPTDIMGGLLNGRAGGGLALAGSSYVVGEKGWEIFTPSVTGTVTSHEDSVRMAQATGVRSNAPRIPTTTPSAQGRSQHIAQIGPFYNSKMSPQELSEEIAWAGRYGH